MKTVTTKKYIRLWNWELSNFNEFIHRDFKNNITIRAGCIPYTIIDDKNYWLMGSFVDKEVLTDFGGNCELAFSQNPLNRKLNDKNFQIPLGCILNEIDEESKGLLLKPILNSLANIEPIVYRGRKTYTRNHSEIWMMFVYLTPAVVLDFIKKFPRTQALTDELFGPIALYSDEDIISGQYDVSPNLQDFIHFLNKECSSESNSCIKTQSIYSNPFQ